jgi:hypothetical protein
MSDNAEFSVGEIVDYKKGIKFYKAQVQKVSQNPITMKIEYSLFYRTKPGSTFRAITTGKYIKQSKHFV